MVVSGIHHVSINVSDLAAARRFYVDALGLEPLPRPELGVPGAWLSAGGGLEVHLIVAEPPPDRGQHFAFLVEDVDVVRDALVAAGHQPTDVGGIDGVCRQVFCHDPDGNRVEFNQRL